jgi:hypothetical protein
VRAFGGKLAAPRLAKDTNMANSLGEHHVDIALPVENGQSFDSIMREEEEPLTEIGRSYGVHHSTI